MTGIRAVEGDSTDWGTSTARSEGWMIRAACRNEDPEIFGTERPGPDADKALAICAGCPVVAQCRADAYAHTHEFPQTTGVWGGEIWIAGRRISTHECERCGGLLAHGRTKVCADCKQPPTRRKQCGTPRGADRHRSHGEVVCEACQHSEREYRRAKALDRKRKPRPSHFARTKGRVVRVTEMDRRGVPTPQIAAELGVTTGTVYRLRKLLPDGGAT